MSVSLSNRPKHALLNGSQVFKEACYLMHALAKVALVHNNRTASKERKERLNKYSSVKL